MQLGIKYIWKTKEIWGSLIYAVRLEGKISNEEIKDGGGCL